VIYEDLEEEAIKVKGVKYVILGDITDMGKARLVRVRKGGWGGSGKKRKRGRVGG